MSAALEAAINEWHASVNDGDLERSAKAVADPIVILGPVTPERFAGWAERSGIRLVPRPRRPVGGRGFHPRGHGVPGDRCEGVRRPPAARPQSGAGPGRLLFAFVRHWSRRASAADHDVAERGRLVLVTEAVHSLTQRGIAATVNAVAHEIGIDQSGASRLVKSATDGRRRQMTVTPSGWAMLERAHDRQEQVFDRLTEGWSEQRRLDFQRAMADLIGRSYALTHDPRR
ncbi:MarR family winged helix-turn-helix transcriptional regulator [Actinomadura kijaniata]|uniref:MarR family winged helix-turn-helix transcriptional regulator n=1 Tax=Actinomadura kijaniata TaxID=46161 RepID=UPI000AC3A7BE|nr:MarR family winged helix-turn-helix transcriptional regulator [Actinomadura kijaniata]